MHMKKITIIAIITLLFTNAFGQEIAKEKEAIKKVINESYVNGIHINSDVDAVNKGFHPGFTMLILSNNSLIKFPLYNWLISIKKRAESNKKQESEITHKFKIIDVTGNAAVVGVELFKDSEKIYTDYFSLYKFEDGWKIVNKIYFSHKKSK